MKQWNEWISFLQLPSFTLWDIFSMHKFCIFMAFPSLKCGTWICTLSQVPLPVNAMILRKMCGNIIQLHLLNVFEISHFRSAIKVSRLGSFLFIQEFMEVYCWGRTFLKSFALYWKIYEEYRGARDYFQEQYCVYTWRWEGMKMCEKGKKLDGSLIVKKGN